MTSILVNCEPGDDGGLQQYFTMEVIEANSQNSLINLTSKDRPTFLVDRLPPGSSIRFNIYASNIKGKSAAISILGSTLGPPEKQTSSSKSYQLINFHLIMVLSHYFHCPLFHHYFHRLLNHGIACLIYH